MTFLFILAVLLVLLIIGVPVAFSLLASSLLYFLAQPGLDMIVPQRLLGALDSFPLLAVPFFVLAGTIMARGGIADQLIGFCNLLVGRFRGGLAQVNVLNSFLIGGMSGSASADAAIDSKVLVPVMRRKGYSNGFASALTAASSTLSPILPPSISLIIYGVMTNVSIGDLFIAGYVPAVLIGVSMMVTVYVISRKRGYGRSMDGAPAARVLLREAWKAMPALLMPVVLLVGLRLGVFTPTELGAVAVVYALLVSVLVYKAFTWRDLLDVLKEAAGTTAMIMLIISAASAFGLVVVYERVPNQIKSVLESMELTPLAFLLIVNISLLVLGMFMEGLSLMIILIPVLAPVAFAVGVDPVHFGLLLVLNFTIGAVTPPIGTVVFTVSSITKVKLTELTREFLPFFFVLVGILMVLTLLPDVVTWLPRLWKAG